MKGWVGPQISVDSGREELAGEKQRKECEQVFRHSMRR
jgi:hypothetical protein